MPITILDYVKSRAGEKDSYTPEDFYGNGVEMLGGCQHCHATIAAYNAYPSTSAYWRCADCIGNEGFPTVEAFLDHESQRERNERGLSWLLRLQYLQFQGLDFEAAVAQVNAEADQDEREGRYDPDEVPVTCPACEAIENITEIRDRTFECGFCETVWAI